MMEYAPHVYRSLSGVFCVYKPHGRSMLNIIQGMQTKLATDLNSMKVRPTRDRVVIQESGPQSALPTVTTVPDLADHPLVLGPRYLEEDFEIGYVSRLGLNSSGVIVTAMGPFRTGLLKSIARANYVRTYHVEGRLGIATQDYLETGRLIEKSTFFHVTQAKMDKVIASRQAANQKTMFHAVGVDRQSQEAYELASRGLLRPNKPLAGPVIYGLKCIHFQPPDFTLEIHTINETCEHLQHLVHTIGLDLKTTAACVLVRRIRYGPFTLHHALLHKHWTAESILENMDLCRPLCVQARNMVESNAMGNLENMSEEGLTMSEEGVT